MIAPLRKFLLALRALNELGPRQVGLYALYRLGLRSGYYCWRSQPPEAPGEAYRLSLAHLPLPDPALLAERLGPEGLRQLQAEAAEILGGRVRLFGADPVPLQLKPGEPLQHWTAYESAPGEAKDIKFTWEPARFGWALTLGRLYWLAPEEAYAQAFWELSQGFLDANPPYGGPHWASAQEVAIRLIALALAGRCFAHSPQSTPQRMEKLAQAIAIHAARIPLTMIYARAQNNNHLLSEAAGLYTASWLLPGHPQANRWRRLGWRWFHRGLQSQISPNGSYTQHSTNYHRLMLQLALWVRLLAVQGGDPFPQASLERLAAATRWLRALLDPESGRVPNLGANDGAYLFPLGPGGFHDYRPSVQAASLAFTSQPACPPGPWDEMAAWFGMQPPEQPPKPQPGVQEQPAVLRNTANRSWVYLRCARFNGRPSHADQLHLDLWWRGLNLAQDAGAYLYNALPPWDNSLTHSAVHNTLLLSGQEQMQRAGRFLYLEWAQGEILHSASDTGEPAMRLTANHNGYRRLGLRHERTAAADPQGWTITDHILARDPRKAAIAIAHGAIEIRLHWLLPDWPWEIGRKGTSEAESGQPLWLESPLGQIELVLPAGELLISRAGQRLLGQGIVSPTWGWASPTYGQKIPALSVAVTIQQTPPTILVSRWVLPVVQSP